MIDSLRARLTLLNVGVMSCLLTAFSFGIYALLAHNLYRRTDDLLKAVVSATIGMITEELIDARDSGVATAPREALKSLAYPDHAFAIFDPDGRLLAEKPLGASSLAPIPDLTRLQLDRPYSYSITPNDRRLRRRAMALRVNVSPTGKPCIIVVSRPLTPLLLDLELLRKVLYAVVPLVLILVGVTGWLLARTTLAPIREMSAHAQRIGAFNSNERLPVVNPNDELGQLATVFNEMLARIEATFSQQRQFMADASHELRTPLSVIQTETSVVLDRPDREAAEYLSALTMIEVQTNQLVHLVDGMFRLSRADAGHYELQKHPIYLNDLLLEAVRSAKQMSVTKGVSLSISPLPEIPYHGDEGLIRQMFANLLDNSIKYTPSGGTVSVGLDLSYPHYVISISDTGIGIPIEAQPHIFERFFRADPARSTLEDGYVGGVGLGLAIVRWIAEAHDGRVDLVQSSEKGTTFAILLPAR